MDDDAAPSARYPLLHRWFVQYNPLYLLSAALVLVGAHLLYRDLMAAGYLLGQLGVPAIAEVYAWTLVGGAALLTRIGLRRPGVLLALLAVLFQGDLTMLTETSVYLGAAGAAAVTVWLASFAAKLWALAWALELRLSRSAFAVPVLAAVGLVVVPRSLGILGSQGAELLLGAWTFGVVATGLWTSRDVRSEAPLDAWGRTVLRRGLAATWATWSVLIAMHGAFWASDHRVSCGVLVPVGLLVATRFVRREMGIWATVAAAIAWTAMTSPGATWLTALLGATTLALHAFRQPQERRGEAREPASSGPYREPEATKEPPAPVPVQHGFWPAPRAARRRLLTGSFMAIYVSLWTLGWSAGPFPDHALALDALLTLAVVVAWSKGIREPIVALAAVYAHYAAAAGWVAAPDTRLEWGLASVGSGFALLLASLAVAYRLRPGVATPPPD